MVTSSSIILAFTHTLDVLILVLTERCHQKPRTFQRKKATREEDRTTVKRIVCTDNEQLDAPISDELDQSKQAQHVLTLRFKLETLKVLDKDILSNVEEEIEKEIGEADLVSELIQLSIARIDNFLEKKKPSSELYAMLLPDLMVQH